MGESTGPILAAGGVVAFNAIIVNGQPPIAQTRTMVGTLIAAAGLSLLEKPFPRVAVALAWLTLASVLLVRVDRNTPSPIETFTKWYGK